MPADNRTIGQTFIVRPPKAGTEAIVTSPSGRMQFMNLWRVFVFTIRATWAGHKVEVKDD